MNKGDTCECCYTFDYFVEDLSGVKVCCGCRRIIDKFKKLEKEKSNENKMY